MIRLMLLSLISICSLISQSQDYKSTKLAPFFTDSIYELVENSISISYRGYSNLDLSIRLSDDSKFSDKIKIVNRMQGEYLVRPGWATDTITLNVFFNDRSDGTSIMIDQIHYKVLPHPKPVFFIEGLDDKGRISKQDLINSIIQVKAPHTLFKAEYRFSFWIYVNGKHSPGSGQTSYRQAPRIGNDRLFSSEMKEFIKNADPGSTIKIEGHAYVVTPGENIPSMIYLTWHDGLSIQLK